MQRPIRLQMRHASRGFSLLEVLVAFVILAMVLGVLMEIFAGGLRNVGRASETQHAVLLAQSKLAAVGIEVPLAAGEVNGEFDKTYRWQVSIKPYQDNQPTAADDSGLPVPILPVMLFEVEVRVLWGDVDPP
ncbi:MAG: type II secretion system protein, partial [Pseudomonadota bacterium]